MEAGITPEQFDNALAQVASIDAQIEKKTAQMDVEVNKIREKYSASLNELEAEKEKQKILVKTYCVENKRELFANMRHIDTVYGAVGFQLGTPAVKWVKDFTEAMSVKKLKDNPGLKIYVRTIEEVNKQALIAERDNPMVAPLLEECGIRITQTESFYIKLKKEDTQA